MDLRPDSAEIDSLFEKFSINGIMGPSHFRTFLIGVQNEANVSESQAAQLMEKSFSVSRDKTEFNKKDFLEYLFNTKLNQAINYRIHHDMTSPMAHYYIFTGHNSYLTGNQLSSACSEKPIAEALRRGVRVVELDLWPNPEGDEVLVYHGRTLTSPVDFKTCLVAIKENAFHKTDYPVIVTLEDHLTPKLQAKAAEVIVDTFGSTLFYPENDEGMKIFPSPESLRGRILISTKPPKEFLEAPIAEPSRPIQEEDDNDDDEVSITKEQESKSTGSYKISSLTAYEKVKEIIPRKVKRMMPLTKLPKDSLGVPGAQISELVVIDAMEAKKEIKEENKSTVETEEISSLKDHEKVKNVVISTVEDEPNKSPVIPKGDQVSHKYKKLISIKAGKPKGKSVLDALKSEELVKRISLSEPELTEVAESSPHAVVKFTHNNFLRIYPYGLRFDSSNYNPIIAWAHGAQMVAANMQGYGKHLWVAQGFFKANGGCGYIKKPTFLLPSTDGSFVSMYNPENSLPVKLHLKVKICMGYGWREQFGEKSFDRFSAPDFYTRVGIAGIEADTMMEKTQTIDDNWMPVWEEEFEFNLRAPEIGVLRLEVYNANSTRDDFGGQLSLPLSELRHGYRVVTLCDEKGDELSKVKLLLHIHLKDATLAQK